MMHYQPHFCFAFRTATPIILSQRVVKSSIFFSDALGGSLTTHQYPRLPEDLSYDPYFDDIWTCTEEPATFLGQTRYCFRVARSQLVTGSCD